MSEAAASESQLYYLEQGTLRESTLLLIRSDEEVFSDEEHWSDTDSERKVQISRSEEKDDTYKKWTFKNGLEWYFEVFADGYNDPKHCLASGELKPCRPLPQIRASEFFGAIAKRKTDAGTIWVYEGKGVNGWTQLVGPLELRSITAKVKRMLQGSHIKRVWDAERNSKRRIEKHPEYPKDHNYVRVRVRSPAWTEWGWSEDSPGYVFYIAMQKNYELKFFFGINIVEAINNGTFTNLNLPTPKGSPEFLLPTIPIGTAKYVHLFAHRYVKRKETFKDKLIWHEGILVEWDHGEFTTVFELCYLNGLSGYGGKSNWQLDRDSVSPRPAIFRAMPDCVKAPWKTDHAEIRILDVKYKNAKEFEAFMIEHPERFVLPEIVHSAKVRVSARTQSDLVKYCLNYMFWETKYFEESRNCQTFSADFFSLLSGEKNTKPYHVINQVMYRAKVDQLLYEPESMEKIFEEYKATSRIDELVI